MNRYYIFEGAVDGIGIVSMAIGPKGLEKVKFGRATKGFFKGLSPRVWEKRSFNTQITNWLKDYHKGKSEKFPYGLNITGTEFQTSVWKAISQIPFGKVRTYSWIANKIGRPKTVRAVGTACGANPIPLVIPCHRVVASNNIGGFSSGLNLKKKLLKLEILNHI